MENASKEVYPKSGISFDSALSKPKKNDLEGSVRGIGYFLKNNNSANSTGKDCGQIRLEPEGTRLFASDTFLPTLCGGREDLHNEQSEESERRHCHYRFVLSISWSGHRRPFGICVPGLSPSPSFPINNWSQRC